MSEVGTRSGPRIKSIGWQVTLAGLGINLALGILYTWSVVSNAVPAEWEWSEADKSLPYSIACLVFALTMVPAGRLQDRLGPRLVASIGGLLVGGGMILASLTTSPMGYMLGFGLMAGAGIGFGYASATPPAVKWFPAARTGLIAGLVVSGFGLSGVYAAPLAKTLIAAFGLPNTMLGLGVAFLVIVVGLSQLLFAPPKGYVPPESTRATASKAPKEDVQPLGMVSGAAFYLLWFMFACGAGAGLMIIAKLSPIGTKQAGLTDGFILVASCAVGNGAGRIVAGMLSDRLGRLPTLCGSFIFQAALLVVLSLAVKGSGLAALPLLMLLAALIGANYGANLSIFPSITKDYYGLKNFGVNYGLVFTAWGIGGFLFSLLVGKIFDYFGAFTYAYYVAVAFLLVAAATTFLVKPPAAAPQRAKEPETEPELAEV